jgi:nitroreductase
LNIHDFRKPGHAIDPIFIERWSPRAFSDEPIPDQVLFSCFEAARWAASSMNAQPWRFLYAKRDSADFPRFLEILQDRPRSWADRAAALIVFAADTLLVIGDQTIDSPTHAFDAGAAAACFALQARMLGWYTHGVASFRRDVIAGILGIPERFRAYAVFAIGRIGDPATLPPGLAEREFPSDRRALDQTVMEGGWRD